MELLRQLVDKAPDDPVLLAGAVVAAWLPICVVGLLCLATVAAVQNYLHRRPRPPRLLVMPPAEVRPLVMRRTITAHHGTNVWLDLTRLTLAVGVVLAFSALILAAGGTMLLQALNRVPSP
jgi:hypothetical protein